MNRADIVQAMSDLLNWDAPDDKVWQARARRFVDQAYFRLVGEVPEALTPDELRVRIPGTYSSGSGTAIDSYISTTSDPFVLEFSPPSASSFSPATDRSWDGLYWLQITKPDGTQWRGQCREFWTGPVPTLARYVTLDRPWTDGTLTNAAYVLSPNYIWLRDDIIRVVGGQRYGATGSPLTMETITSAIWHDEWSNQNSRQYNYPRRLRAEKAYQHVAPNIAPTVTLNSKQEAAWGPEPVGVFTYVFTYCWGYRDLTQKSQSGSPIPLFESSPSPVSSSVTVPDINRTVTIGLPDIAWEQNYGDAGTLRYGKTGWYKRLYRARYTTGIVPGHTSIEHPEIYQFLADVDDITTSFTDDGSIVPDYFLRLPLIHGYRAWSPWPLPAGEEWTEYQLLVQRAAEKLMNDSDAPRVANQVEDALVFLAVAYLARHDKDTATAEMYEGKAQQVIARFRQQVANPTGMVDREGWEWSMRPRGGWPRARGV